MLDEKNIDVKWVVPFLFQYVISSSLVQIRNIAALVKLLWQDSTCFFFLNKKRMCFCWVRDLALSQTHWKVRNEKLTAPDDKKYVNVYTEQVRLPAQRTADPQLRCCPGHKRNPVLSAQQEVKFAESSVTLNAGEWNGNALSPAQQSLFVVFRTADCWSGAEPWLFR